jgi:hypothetical protein
MHTYIHTYIHIYIYIHTYIYISRFLDKSIQIWPTCMHTYIHTYIQVLGQEHSDVANTIENIGVILAQQGMYVCVHVCMCSCMHGCMWLCVHQQVCMCVHVIVYCRHSCPAAIYICRSPAIYVCRFPAIYVCKSPAMYVGPDHVHIIPIQQKYTFIHTSSHMHTGKYDLSLQKFQEALDIRISALGPDHVYIYIYIYIYNAHTFTHTQTCIQASTISRCKSSKKR